MMGGPPTQTGFPTEVIVSNIEVGAISDTLGLEGFSALMGAGIPTKLQERAG